MTDAVDLFAGAGGFSLGARSLGLDVLGLEIDPYACATARAAGLPTLQVDLSERRFPASLGDPRDVPGLIASPPCQTFSKAGSGSGRLQLDLMIAAIRTLAGGRWPRAEVAATHDPRTALVLLPLLWAMWARPEWVALEQVPPVLPVWEWVGRALIEQGYDVATGLVHAEAHGVPQTRTRAVLVASRVHDVHLPVATHSRFHNRSPERLDPDVAPWVSMAEALRWGEDHRRDIWMCPTNLRPHAALRHPDHPAATLAFGHERPRWVSAAELAAYRARVAAEVAPRVNNQSGVEFDLAWPADRPAPTIAGRPMATMPGANANRHNGRTKSRNDGVKLSAAECSVLQSFPADYPWAGGVTSVFRQIGNAMPPLLAEAVLGGCT